MIEDCNNWLLLHVMSEPLHTMLFVTR